VFAFDVGAPCDGMSTTFWRGGRRGLSEVPRGKLRGAEFRRRLQNGARKEPGVPFSLGYFSFGQAKEK